MSASVTLRCEDCGNVVEDAPMRIARCLECGGRFALASDAGTELVDVDDVEVGDWIITEYDLDGYPELVVDVDRGRERIWIVDPSEPGRSGPNSSPSPSYVNRNGVRVHIPRGSDFPGPLADALQGDEDEPEPTGPPRAPMNLPKYLREGAEKQSADRLRNLAEYAEQLARWKEVEAERELEQRAAVDADDVPDEWDDREDEWNEAVDSAREKADLPGSKGSITTKTIDGRDYYYLQWREGDSTPSQYVAPVNPASND